MIKLHVQMRDGAELLIEGQTGVSLMEALRSGGCDEIRAVCGGSCSCATCHVYLETDRPDLLSPVTDDEDALLEFSDDRRDTSRLSCQVILVPELAGLRVLIAPDSGDM